MEIEVNGSPKEILEKTNLKELVDSMLNATKGVAIAINDVVIPKVQWPETKLSQNDKVLFIKATQGG
ncbi:MAG: sulfur carrier protein ThiS [Bacteroidetes bacterium]|nr:sulfur carrier protein ThiS [Bacteroidota bacterium]